MKGVNLFDQLIANCLPKLHNQHYLLEIWMHGTENAKINSFIIYKSKTKHNRNHNRNHNSNHAQKHFWLDRLRHSSDKLMHFLWQDMTSHSNVLTFFTLCRTKELVVPQRHQAPPKASEEALINTNGFHVPQKTTAMYLLPLEED